MIKKTIVVILSIFIFVSCTTFQKPEKENISTVQTEKKVHYFSDVFPAIYKIEENSFLEMNVLPDEVIEVKFSPKEENIWRMSLTHNDFLVHNELAMVMFTVSSDNDKNGVKHYLKTKIISFNKKSPYYWYNKKGETLHMIIRQTSENMFLPLTLFATRKKPAKEDYNIEKKIK